MGTRVSLKLWEADNSTTDEVTFDKRINASKTLRSFESVKLFLEQSITRPAAVWWDLLSSQQQGKTAAAGGHTKVVLVTVPMTPFSVIMLWNNEYRFHIIFVPFLNLDSLYRNKLKITHQPEKCNYNYHF